MAGAKTYCGSYEMMELEVYTQIINTIAFETYKDKDQINTDVDELTDLMEKANIEAEKSKLYREFSNRVNYQAINAIKENAEITDNRLNFY